MMRIRHATATLAMVAAAGNLSQRGFPSDFTRNLSLMAAVVRQAAENARSLSRPGTANGPVLVDLVSLGRALPEAQRDSLTVTRLVHAVGFSVEASTEQQALVLKRGHDGSLEQAWVKDGGIFVRLDSVFVAGPNATAVVSVSTTDRRSPNSSGVCPSRMRLTLRWSVRKWSIQHNHLLLTC